MAPPEALHHARKPGDPWGHSERKTSFEKNAVRAAIEREDCDAKTTGRGHNREERRFSIGKNLRPSMGGFAFSGVRRRYDRWEPA